MNGQFYGDRFTPVPNVAKTENEANLPDNNLEPLPEQVPAEAVMGNEMPIGGTHTDPGQQEAPRDSILPHFDAPVKETQMGDPTPVVSRMDEPAPYKPTSSAGIREDWGSKPVVTMPTVVPAVVKPDPMVANSAQPTALLSTEESEHFRNQWNAIQGKFVDEPRIAVQQADALVSDVVEKITVMFASEHTSLESQWNQGNEVSTEDLRKALQRYRSFFNRLVV